MRVHVVAPEGFDDPGRPSGGNIYDRRIVAGLPALGWDVRVAAVPGPWPSPDETARVALDHALAAVPDGENVLIDGLIAAPSAEPLLAHTHRLHITVLLHMPLTATIDGPPTDSRPEHSDRPAARDGRPTGPARLPGGAPPRRAVDDSPADPRPERSGRPAAPGGRPNARLPGGAPPDAPTDGAVVGWSGWAVPGGAGADDASAGRSEPAVLRAAAGVIVTSEWTRREVLTRFALRSGRVHVARPGVDRVDVAPRNAAVPRADGRLLCVGALAPHKGQDLLVEALAELAGEDWDCVLAGPLDRDPPFVARLRARIAHLGLDHRVCLTGTLTGDDLHRAYAAAGLLVVPSRAETYGMVVTEALAHGVPVLAADTGGLPEALGVTPRGTRPGRLVPPDDPRALATALRHWLHDAHHRDHLRTAAHDRAPTLPTWRHTTEAVASALRNARRE